MGDDVAAVDGVTAFQHAGLTGYDDDRIHVSVKHTTEVASVSGVVVHKVIRRVGDELVPVGLPRTRPAVAAVRAAQNAVALADDLVLRVGLIGWRLTPHLYLDQICPTYWKRRSSRAA